MIYLDGPSLASNCAKRLCGGCQGHAATRSVRGRAWTATAPPRKPASTSEGSGVVLVGSSWGATVRVETRGSRRNTPTELRGESRDSNSRARPGSGYIKAPDCALDLRRGQSEPASTYTVILAHATTALHGALHGTGPEFVVGVGNDAVAQRGKE